MVHTLVDVFPQLQFPHWLWNRDRTIAVRYHADGSLWVLDMNYGREYPAQSLADVIAIVGTWTASQDAWALRVL